MLMIAGWWSRLRQELADTRDHWRMQQAQIRASRLERHGQVEEAFVAAADALERTKRLGESADYALPFVVVAYERLARQMHRPGVPNELIQQALVACRQAAERTPRLERKLRSHIEWFEWRLATAVEDVNRGAAEQ